MDMDKPHFIAKDAKTIFLQFKGQRPFKSKKEISAVQH
jgi:hypothetical protein